jgi:hypothetical protein
MKRPDGLYGETRFKYKRGINIRIVGGQHKGKIAVVESLIGMIQEGDNWIAEPGYNVKLDDGRCITIRWDLVEEEAP